MLRFMLLALLLCLATTVWADKPLCVDPVTGLPVETQGACFVTYEPGYWWIVMPTADGIIGAGPLDQKAFLLVHKDNVRFYSVDRDVELRFCPPSLLDLCLAPAPPPPETVYSGTGHVVANINNSPSMCPTTVHIHGTVKAPNPSTDWFQVRAATVIAKDKSAPEGCRFVVNEITLKAR